MKNTITVKATDEVTIFKNSERKIVIATIEENKVYKATLHKETEEYFATSKENREFLVGHIDIMGKLILKEEFEIVEDIDEECTCTKKDCQA